MYLGAPDPVDAIEISGVPDLKLAIPGGIHGDLATAAIAVNCVPALLEAKPGLRWEPTVIETPKPKKK